MRIFIFALLIMCTPTITQAESIAYAKSKSDKPYGGILVWGTRNKPSIINPFFTTTSVSMSLMDLLFNRLVRLNSKGEIESDLAESWDISPDGLVYTFHLRKGVRFHDGKECTADDIKFTYDKIMAPEVNSPFRPYFASVQEIKAIDKYTFQIILKKPSVPFIYRLVREIVPKHLLEKTDLKICYFNFRPMGTGPFKFKEWTKDNQIILEYNPDYYEGRPYLDKVIVKVYPDSESLWTGLMRGEVDYATFIERKDYEVIKDDPAFKVFALAWDNYYALLYNLDDSLLSDKRIREAIAYGIDRKALIEKIAYGYGKECTGPFYPGSSVFNPSVMPYEYNPEKAIALLQEAGWKDKDNDGILEKDSEELELKVLVDSKNEVDRRIIMAIRQQLQEMGIKIKVQLYDAEEMLTQEFLEQNRPQAHLRLSMAMADGAEDIAAEGWYSQESKKVAKLWVYQNEEVDRLFELGEVTQDKKKRQEIYQKIHQLIYDNQPACFLYFPFVFHAVSAKFENVDEFFTLYMPHYTMKDWYLKQKGGEKDGGN
jgi:peptide/nickel transport system substrate-binding protein